VSKVVPGGPADLSQQVYVGDQILSINGTDISTAGVLVRPNISSVFDVV
jgi:C-terminal processing protease CtpA/Prc